jgi:hypothetical protein
MEGVMTVQFEVALVREQGVEFAVVAVKPHVLNSAHEQNSIRSALAPHCGWAVPIVLMAQDDQGVPTYSGRRDVVGFLANSVLVEQLPWRTMTLRDAA